MEDGRLYVLAQHPNFPAALSLWPVHADVSGGEPLEALGADSRGRVAGASLFMALPLSDSRTGMIAFC